MYKIFNSKKAVGIDDFIPLLVAMFIFLFAVFFLLIEDSVKDKSKAADIDSLKETIESTDLLLLYLQTPVGENINIADLLTKSHLNKDYKSIEKESKKFFDPIYMPLESWSLIISSEKDRFEIQGKGYNRDYMVRLIAQTKIPLPDSTIVEIKLYNQKKTAENIVMPAI